MIGGLLAAPACTALAGLYADARRFRSVVTMSRHGFGRGEYKYFALPLPDLVLALRMSLYPHLVAIIVTGHSGYPEIERARANWRDFRVLIKPYAADDLIRTVRNAAGIAALRKATSRLPTR